MCVLRKELSPGYQLDVSYCIRQTDTRRLRISALSFSLTARMIFPFESARLYLERFPCIEVGADAIRVRSVVVVRIPVVVDICKVRGRYHITQPPVTNQRSPCRIPSNSPNLSISKWSSASILSIWSFNDPSLISCFGFISLLSAFRTPLNKLI